MVMYDEKPYVYKIMWIMCAAIFVLPVFYFVELMRTFSRLLSNHKKDPSIGDRLYASMFLEPEMKKRNREVQPPAR